MLILCAPLSVLSSLRVILTSIYLNRDGTAGSADKDVRQNATDRLALFMCRWGQECIDIYMNHGALSHFSSSVDQSAV